MIKPGPQTRNIDSSTNLIAKKVVDAAFKVHFALGPGLLETVYEACLVHKLRQMDLKVEQQVKQPILFEDIKIENGLRLDLLVENKLVVELKAVEVVLPLHEVQLLTYLKLSGYELGLLINFNVPVMKKGIKRIVLTKNSIFA